MCLQIYECFSILQNKNITFYIKNASFPKQTDKILINNILAKTKQGKSFPKKENPEHLSKHKAHQFHIREGKYFRSTNTFYPPFTLSLQKKREENGKHETTENNPKIPTERYFC